MNVESLIVIIASAKTIIHISSMKTIEAKFKIPEEAIRCIFSKISTIAIHHAMSVILHKKKNRKIIKHY